MLKLPTNAGEWGFVIVLSVLFAGLAFGVIYSQVKLDEIKHEQAVRDTESSLHVLREITLNYQEEHGEIKTSLSDMGVEEEALETRHAHFDDEVVIKDDTIRLQATLKKYDRGTCTLTSSKGADPEIIWTSE